MSGTVYHVRGKLHASRTVGTGKHAHSTTLAICGDWYPSRTVLGFHKLKNKPVTKCEACRAVLIGRELPRDGKAGK